MKYKVIIILLMFLFVGSVGNAQSFRDNNNMLLGKVESDGTIRNANNMKLGKIFDDGTITGITDLKHAVNDGIFYNMNGMRIERPAKGLYIWNGKKIIIK